MWSIFFLNFRGNLTGKRAVRTLCLSGLMLIVPPPSLVFPYPSHSGSYGGRSILSSSILTRLVGPSGREGRSLRLKLTRPAFCGRRFEPAPTPAGATAAKQNEKKHAGKVYHPSPEASTAPRMSRLLSVLVAFPGRAGRFSRRAEKAQGFCVGVFSQFVEAEVWGPDGWERVVDPSSVGDRSIDRSIVLSRSWCAFCQE